MSDWKKKAFEGQEGDTGSEDFGAVALERLKRQAAAGNRAAQKALRDDGGDWVKEAFAGESGYVGNDYGSGKSKSEPESDWRDSVFDPKD